MYFEVLGRICTCEYFFFRIHFHAGAPGGPMEVPLMVEVPLTIEGSSSSAAYGRDCV